MNAAACGSDLKTVSGVSTHGGLLLLLPLLGGLNLLILQPPVADDSLVELAERQHWSAVSDLLASGQSGRVDATQADGMTALHWAVHHDQTDSVRLLLEAGAPADAITGFGVTPLSLACTNGNGEIVALLLKAGARADGVLSGGESLLMVAARTGRVEPVRQLLAAGAPVNACDQRGQTAIMWAAAEGHADVVRLLIESGADFTTSLRSGFSAMFFAVREGRSEVVRVLLQAGADPNAVMKPEKSGGRAPRAGTSPLIMAVENGHFELAVELLQAGADPNDQRCGFTALHVLTWVRKPNRGDGEDGDPAPAGSGNLSSLEFARMLVGHGANVNARLEKGAGGKGRLNQTGATPFLMAADTADLPYLKCLLELGADPALPNADLATPVMAAAGLGTLAPGEEAGTEDECLATVRFLVELGADVNAVDQNGETAMHGAAYKSAPEVIRWLHGNGAKIEVWNRHNKYGWTPLLIARGYRPGNFRPAAATIEALREIMLASGVTPPMDASPSVPQEDQYAPKKKQKP